MLDPTQKYECDAGEVIALHGPGVDGLFVAVIKSGEGSLIARVYGEDGRAFVGGERFHLRPVLPKLHVKCWVVVWECDDGGVGGSSHIDLFDALKTARRFERQHVPVAILAIDTTLTAGDGMEEQS